jgi:hypothetical protein
MYKNLVGNVTAVQSGGCEHQFRYQYADFDEDYNRAPNESDDL